MPWSSLASSLSAVHKLILLQSALEGLLRDTITIKDREGRVIYSNRESVPKWRWRNEKLRQQQALQRLALAQLPDELTCLSLHGIEDDPIPVHATLCSPSGCDPSDEVWSTIAHVGDTSEQTQAELILSSGGDEGPADRRRAVKFAFPAIGSFDGSASRAISPIGDEALSVITAEVAMVSKQGWLPGFTWSCRLVWLGRFKPLFVLQDPFGRQLFLQNAFDSVPSMLLIIREMPAGNGNLSHLQIVMTNTSLTEQTGHHDTEIVLPPSEHFRALRRLFHADGAFH
jgi:hypothetical protein